MKKVIKRVVALGVMVVLLFSVFGMVGCSPRQLDPPRDFIIYERYPLVGQGAVISWLSDPGAEFCVVYVWRKDYKDYVRATTRIPPGGSDEQTWHISDLRLEEGENLIRIISRAPRNRRNILDSEPAYFVLVMDELGYVTVK